MKLNGKRPEGPNRVTIAIPRSDGREDLIFIAQAVLSHDEAEKLCPRPEPPMKMLPGGEREADLKDARFKERLESFSKRRYAWLILKSLEATPGLEWETVDMGRPDTWENFRTELAEAGFSEAEIGRIQIGVSEANALDETKIEAARQRFLVSLRETSGRPSSQNTDLLNMQSGVPASESVFDPQGSVIAGKPAT